MTDYFTAEQVYQSLKEENAALQKFCHGKQAENEILSAGYAAARLEIESLKAQLAAQQPGAVYAALPVTPQFPDHPEPMVMDWSALEISVIAQYGRDMYEAGKRASHGQAPVQAAPAAVAWPSEMHEAMCPALTGGRCTCERNDPAVDKAWARFCGGIGDGPDAPYPGMISAFERYYSQSFIDKDWRNEASVWAAAWKQAMLTAAAPPTQPAPQQEAQEPVVWYVTGCGRLLDEDEAKAEARRIGGTARAMPLYTAPQADSQPAPTSLEQKYADYVETVGKMLEAVGYTEAYALQWPKEKASVTFKRWFDEQISAARAPADSVLEDAAVEQQAGATKEHLRLVRVIADKIEDGTLFQSGIYSNKDLARFVRNVADAARNPRGCQIYEVRTMGELFGDLKTDEEKAAFFLSGKGYETGVIAAAIQNDVAMAYQRCAEHKKELEALQSQKAVAWARPVFATEAVEPFDKGDLVDVEFYNHPERPEGEGWRPLVFADTDDARAARKQGANHD